MLEPRNQYSLGQERETRASATNTSTRYTPITNMAGGDQKNETKGETKVETKVEGNDKKEKKEEGFKFGEKNESKGGMEGFMQFLWNPETKEFLGRTGMSWCKLNIMCF